MRIRRISFTRAAALLACLVGWLHASPSAAQQPPPADPRVALRKWLETMPDHPGVMWDLARAEARAGNAAEASRWISKILDRRFDVDLTDRAFDAMRTSATFQKLSKRAAPLRFKGGKSPVLFRLGGPDMIPEGIAYDPVGDAYYIGSIHERRIVRMSHDGKPSDFVPPGRDGLWSVLGMCVQPTRRLLFVMSAAGRASGADEGKSGLFVYDLESGNLARKILVEARPPKHLFNDVAVSPRGDVFLTDSEAGAVWRVRPLKDALEPLVAPGTLTYPNGIALSADGSTLFVADAKSGLSRVDAATGAVRPLDHAPDVSLHGIDGLYLEGDGLVAVQNGLPVPRIVRYTLSKEQDSVTAVRVLESRHPLFAIPTTGAVIPSGPVVPASGAPTGSFLALLATSYLEALDESGRIKDGAPRGDVVVLRVPLR